MDLPLSIPLQPVVIERSGVQKFGAPVFDRAPLKSGWRVLANKEKFMAVIQKSKENNESRLSRTSPSAQRKQHTAVDNWFQLLNALDPDLDEERYWDTDIVERHGMHIVRTLYTHIYLYVSSSFSSSIFPKARARRTTCSLLRILSLKKPCSLPVRSAALAAIRKRGSRLDQS